MPFGFGSSSSSSCDSAIANAQQTLDKIDQELTDTIFKAATHNLAPDNQHIVLVMGYPQLYSNETKFQWDHPRMSSTGRIQINSLVVQLNSRLQSAVDPVHQQLSTSSTTGPQIYCADPNVPDEYATAQAPPDRSITGNRFCDTYTSYLNGGNPPNPDTESIPITLDEWKKGIFHPTTDGFRVMKDAAQNVLSVWGGGGTSYEGCFSSHELSLIPSPSGQGLR
jgi:hypothetical protein